jgi:Zn-dependent protease
LTFLFLDKGALRMFGSLSDMLFRIPALLLALTIHEYAHGAVSYSKGDPTPEIQGRLTMNPLAHLDVMGTIMLVVVGFGWAKPVMIDPRYYRHPKRDIIEVSFAGPGANLVLCLIAAVLMILMSRMNMLTGSVLKFLQSLMIYNVYFAFFNLLPIPPLDGSKILMELMPNEMAYKYETMIAPYSMYILIALCLTGLVSTIIVPFANLYLNLIQVLIGIFI